MRNVWMYGAKTVVLMLALVLWGCNGGESGGDTDQDVEGNPEERMEGGEHVDHDAHEHGEESGSAEMTAPEGPVEMSGEVVDGVRVVEVKARKFEFDPARINVQKGEKIRLKVTSEDVTHGIGIKGYDVKRRLEPEETETIEFKADEAGQHQVFCTVYCGSGHGDMTGQLVVLENE